MIAYEIGKISWRIHFFHCESFNFFWIFIFWSCSKHVFCFFFLFLLLKSWVCVLENGHLFDLSLSYAFRLHWSQIICVCVCVRMNILFFYSSYSKSANQQQRHHMQNSNISIFFLIVPLSIVFVCVCLLTTPMVDKTVNSGQNEGKINRDQKVYYTYLCI